MGAKVIRVGARLTRVGARVIPVGAKLTRVGARGSLVGGVVAVVLIAATHAQGPQATLQVRGRVVSDETGEPLPNARVLVNGTATSVRTDLGGRFTIAAPANATLIISKAGFVRREDSLAARRNLGQPFDVRMIRSTAIAGRVTNEYGEAVVGLIVTLAPADHPGQMLRTLGTDDRGEYRLGGLPPGTYLARVEFQDRTLIVRPPLPGSPSTPNVPTAMYYPGVSEPRDAAPLTVAPGEERPDVDFQVTGRQTLALQLQSVSPFINSIPRTPLASGTSSIRGTVISSSGGTLAHAVVALFPSAKQSYDTVSADEEGRYEFSSLAAGSYLVAATKPGFRIRNPSPTAFSPYLVYGGVTIAVAAGQGHDGVDVTLDPLGSDGGGSSITGHVFDEVGEPVSGARVGLLVWSYRSGRRRLVTAAAGRLTDDRGEFRLPGVPDGRYILAASTGDGPVNNNGGYAATFYPGTGIGSEAQFITVNTGDDVKGLDFNLVTTSAVRITGKLLDPEGNPVPPNQLNLASRSTLDSQMDAIINTDGTFEFRNVPPGSYVIRAGRGSDSSGRERDFVAYPVTIAQNDVIGLTLQMPTPTTIKGRVTFDSVTGATPPTSGIAFTTVPTDPDLAPWSIAVGDLQSDATFQMTGISGVRRLLTARLPKNWTVKSIVSDGIDVTDEPLEFGRPTQPTRPFEVVLTDRVNSVSGTVTDDRSRRLAGVRVVLFSTEADRWYPASRFVRSIETGADGSFSITGMPVGSYFIAPTQSFRPGDEGWSEPAFLESLQSSARSISMGEGDSQSISLRLSSR